MSTASLARSGLTLKPMSVATRPARARPYPRCRVTVSAAWAGEIQTGIVTDRLPLLISTMSPLTSISRSAVAGASSAALSQVSLVSGFGSSCSHALFAKRPSHTLGSGRKTSSTPWPVGVGEEAEKSALTDTVFGGNAVLPIMPSCSHLRQALSNALGAGAGVNVAGPVGAAASAVVGAAPGGAACGAAGAGAAGFAAAGGADAGAGFAGTGRPVTAPCPIQ